jgi:phosphatidylethanolamine/phosphatidyl-N-methylethanolamine N-methyltransferase
MEIQAVHKSYARWAPIYDHTFGAVTHAGRKRVAALANAAGGRLLEVGVGTGMSLPHYSPNLKVTGIDASPDMLDRAREKQRSDGHAHVEALVEMDARAMAFADASFDHVVALHIMSVVPEPKRVLAELARVCKPGGSVYIVNHFAREKGVLAAVEKLMAPLDHWLGWHSGFQRRVVMGHLHLRLEAEESLPPLGIMTLLRFQKAT